MKLEPIRAALPHAPQAEAKNNTAGSRLWSAFWQEFCPEDEPHERCHIPGDGQQVADRHWRDFADRLPREAKIIDLGCGAGIVGRLLLNHRPDLRVTGVDFADVPALSVPNLTVHPWTCMEELPFERGSFDAAISLFGIEYGNIDRAARELGRVMKPGARFSFLTHHRDSEIACEGRTRQTALRTLLSERVRRAFLAGSVTETDRQLGRLRSQFPGEPSIALFSTYIRKNLASSSKERQAIWQGMLDALEPEIALLSLLEGSTKSAAELGAWLPPLLSIMRGVSITVLRRGSGQPIAWHVAGVR